jgi:hypothetical protein
MNRRRDACHALLDTFSNTTSCLKVLFTEEYAIYRSSHNRNVVFWVKENSHFMVEFEHNPPHVMWAGMTATHLIDLYFFDGPVNATSYAEMLVVWLIPQLRDRGLMEDVWLQHDGAPAHFALTVRDILNEHFLGRWIGHGSPTSSAPLSWPPRSPDLTTSDNTL